MKRALLSITLLLATASVVFAQTAPMRLSPTAIAKVKAFVPNADLENLTVVQYAQIVTLLDNSNNLRAGEDPDGAIKVILNAQ